MKKCLLLVLVGAMLLLCLTGCRRTMPDDTTPTPAPTQPTVAPTQEPTQLQGTADTQSARILLNIWNTYADEERFAAYGGAIEHSVSDGPGDLDIANTEELTVRYLLPEDQLTAVKEAASLVHLMNNNIFTGVVFGLNDPAAMQTVAKALRDSVQNNRWICGQPERLLIANVDNGYLLMVFGSNDAVDVFRGKLSGVYAAAPIIYDEDILA